MNRIEWSYRGQYSDNSLMYSKQPWESSHSSITFQMQKKYQKNTLNPGNENHHKTAQNNRWWLPAWLVIAS